MQNKLHVQHFFDAAHQLTDSDDLVTKACANLHGHTYAVQVDAEVDELNGAGMVVDFKAIKNIIDTFDHKYINNVLDTLGWADTQPTAENIAYVLFNLISNRLKIKVTRIAVCEGYKGAERASWAIYTPDK